MCRNSLSTIDGRYDWKCGSKSSGTYLSTNSKTAQQVYVYTKMNKMIPTLPMAGRMRKNTERNEAHPLMKLKSRITRTSGTTLMMTITSGKLPIVYSYTSGKLQKPKKHNMVTTP